MTLQPDKADLKAIGATQALNERTAERLAGAGAAAPFVEELGDLGLALLVEQLGTGSIFEGIGPKRGIAELVPSL